ncbi:uncharacterized protein L201_004932 [Kwoniella dendrophila CBS 6074]|uniref:Methyltransferase type 11 domain-containing protein n=1 Tax=Kwoniella dendrophila CBS 6074 TaxID=1295534 RepID=A0AAX4JX85_9TREE
MAPKSPSDLAPTSKPRGPGTLGPPPLIVDIQRANSPPRMPSTSNTVKGKIQARSITPMDFLSSGRNRIDLQDGLDNQRATRKSVDQRGPIDSSIKGVPQGWEDEILTNGTNLKSGSHSSHPVPPVHVQHPSSIPPQKLGVFKETRTKLSSFSGSMKAGFSRDKSGDKEKEKEKEEKKQTGGLRLNKGSIRSTQRSSSMMTMTGTPLSLHPSNRPSSPKRMNNHYLTHSVHSDKSFNTQNTNESIPLIPPTASAPTESTESSAADFSQLFTPTTRTEHEYPASITSSQSTQSRDRVMGLVKDSTPVPPPGRKTFGKPTIDEVLPFAAGHPFAAWSAPVSDEAQPSPGEHGASVVRRGSVSMSVLSPKVTTHTDSTVSAEGWKEIPRPRSSMPGKKIWVDGNGEAANGVYQVGYERDILELESRLHETMYEILGEKHTLVEFEETPTAILDIGTGAGHWPISMALEYPNTAFVGLDSVPCQIDLSVLADAERRCRSSKNGERPPGMGMWENLERRTQWQRGDFLEELPFDTGVFDLVHIRFTNLGIPESKWFNILEEATRVLKRGGKIEIVETSYTLPSNCPANLKNSFASILLSNMIQPFPFLTIQFNLSSIESLNIKNIKPSFHQKWNGKDEIIPGGLEDAILNWVKSAVEYKGTGLIKNQNPHQGIAGKVREELKNSGGKKWDFENLSSATSSEKKKVAVTAIKDKEVDEDAREVNVWVWIATKK